MLHFKPLQSQFMAQTIKSNTLIIDHTKNWIKSVILDLNLCPFAHAIFNDSSIHFQVDNHVAIESRLQNLLNECIRLDKHPKIATTLFICPEGVEEFDDYLALLELAEGLLNVQGYQGIYQIASFHPDYCFADSSPEDAANFTNRSPYPIFHLLRESSIDQALRSYSSPENIPNRNISLTRELGTDKLKTLLSNCFTTGKNK